MRTCRLANGGFTLPELVMVLVLIGVLAAVALPRLDIKGFEDQSFARELVLAVRHAQRLAMASGCHVQVNVSNTEYEVLWTGGGAGGCGTGAVRHPSKGGSLTGTGEIYSGGSVTFDGFGRTSNGLFVDLPDGRQVSVASGSGYVRY